jgi:DNA-binding PadR family transcriptional regulator
LNSAFIQGLLAGFDKMINLNNTAHDRFADRDLYSGLIRLHILHHAVEEPIFGLGKVEELARHGYKISPGTLYPLLHGLERKGYLRATEQRDGKSRRTVYRATAQGKRALEAAKLKVRELFAELIVEKQMTAVKLLPTPPGS